MNSTVLKSPCLCAVATFLMIACTSCQPEKKQPTTSAPDTESTRQALRGESTVPTANRTPSGTGASAASSHPELDAKPAVPVVFTVEIWRIPVPAGSISQNEEFWKRCNEDIVGFGTRDLLFKNGIRVGDAPFSEFEYFRQFIDERAQSERMVVTGPSADRIEVDMKKGLMEQTLFVFDAQNVAIGRSYDRSENVLNVAFEPTPRKPGYVRLKVTPMVRSQRTRLEFSVTNEEREITFVQPAMIYDLNLRADIAPETFLIIAPSSDASVRTSVGHQFLTRESPTEKKELIVIIIPRAFRAQPPR
jgi:hypothetical protein